MSRYINDIIKTLREHPERWTPCAHPTLGYRSGDKLNDGLFNSGASIHISHYRVTFQGVEMPMTWWDGVRISWAIRRWYRTVPINHLDTIHRPL